ncbi:MAG: hypothetical protein LHV68_13555 [Elusimicrobia bacterium]|nr:hypothetical protein [Candidatus Liberimonas magnetica]
MLKKNTKHIFILVSLLLSACSQPKGFPDNAKLCGNYFISCIGVKKNMYHCRIYTRWSKRLIADKNYVYPFSYQNISEPDLAKRITRCEGDVIYFDRTKKLVATNMPENAECIQGAKGGVWVDCKRTDDKNNRYVCIVYDIKGANIISSGEYVLKRFGWDAGTGKVRYVNAKELKDRLTLVYYGGVGISVRNKLVLLPDGWVDYPNPESSHGGTRVKYDSQANIIKEETY